MSSKYTDDEAAAILNAARENIDRLANFKVTERADGVVEEWRLPPRDPEPEPRKLDTQPFDWWREIDRRIANASAADRKYIGDLLIELVIELRAEADRTVDGLKEVNATREAKLAALTDQLHQLTDQRHAPRVENANARADIAELRAALASGGKVLDLTPSSLRTRVN